MAVGEGGGSGRAESAGPGSRAHAQANTAAQAFGLAEQDGIGLGERIAGRARRTAAGALGHEAGLEVAMFDREGRIVGRAG